MHYLDILSCLKFKNFPLGPNHGGAFGSHKMYKMARFHCLKSCLLKIIIFIFLKFACSFHFSQ